MKTKLTHKSSALTPDQCISAIECCKAYKELCSLYNTNYHVVADMNQYFMLDKQEELTDNSPNARIFPSREAAQAYINTQFEGFEFYTDEAIVNDNDKSDNGVYFEPFNAISFYDCMITYYNHKLGIDTGEDLASKLGIFD